MEDNQNLKLCNESVFRSIFDDNFRLLRNFLTYKFKNFDKAEDVAQNSFVILWENCKILKPEQAKSFLFTTAIRLSLNDIKHQKVVSNYNIRLQLREKHNISPEFLMVEDELRCRLELAINNLPEKQKMVFLMNRFDNQSYAEISSILNISVKAVEKRMHLALVSLRKVIKNV